MLIGLLQFIRENQEDVFLIDTLVFQAVWYDNYQSTALEIYFLTDDHRFLSFGLMRPWGSKFQI